MRSLVGREVFLLVESAEGPGDDACAALPGQFAGAIGAAGIHDHDFIRQTLEGSQGLRQIALFVGPEGGVAEDELAVLQNAGADVLSLGEAILRIETAAIGLIAAVNVVRTLAKN